MNKSLLKLQIRCHEGKRYTPYNDTNGHLTVGIGHLMSNHEVVTAHRWSEEEIMNAFDDDVDIAIRQCERMFTEWDRYSENRQHAIVDMMFNRGPGAMAKSTKIVPELKEQRWKTAAKWMLDSEWGRQVGKRARTLAMMVEKDVPFEEARNV